MGFGGVSSIVHAEMFSWLADSHIKSALATAVEHWNVLSFPPRIGGSRLRSNGCESVWTSGPFSGGTGVVRGSR
jgi:hypothetical protein